MTGTASVRPSSRSANHVSRVSGLACAWANPRCPICWSPHLRPGFYFRVLTEGRVQAGDAIVRTRAGIHGLSVAEVNALLYLPDRDMDKLRKIVDVPALSPGWQQSFHDMLAAHESATAPTAPPIGVEPGWSGFRRLRVAATQRESPTVLSIEFEAVDHSTLPRPLAGQYLTIRIPDAGEPLCCAATHFPAIPAPLATASASNAKTTA